MWQQLATCAAPPHIAFCIPWFGGSTVEIYWYGILAAVGIFVGAFYAAKHVEMEGGDPDWVWDALLWVLLAGLLGARLTYVVAENITAAGAGQPVPYPLSDPINLLNPRGGGLNIFGGAVAGAIVLYIYSRMRHEIDMWLMADAGLLGLLLGQGIGRFGNLINREWFGGPTGSPVWGILIPLENPYRPAGVPADARFHPLMLYEAFWLFLVFAVLYNIFRRNQPRMVRGTLTGAYLALAGVGRFLVEFWRVGQPTITFSGGLTVNTGHLFAMLYVVVGLIILLDRTGYLRIPFIKRPATRRQREQQYQEILTQRRRRERALEQQQLREQRKREREQARARRVRKTAGTARRRGV
jgi:phosphatidylglycerol:prolipoprotein diacylglycerol transferase